MIRYIAQDGVWLMLNPLWLGAMQTTWIIFQLSLSSVLSLCPVQVLLNAEILKASILSLGQSLHSSTNGSPHPVKKIQKNFKNNYASVECGAKILSANNEAKVMHSWGQYTL